MRATRAILLCVGVSITEKARKIKGKVQEVAFGATKTLSRAEQGLTADFFVVLLFILVAFSSFSLGRISVAENKAPEVIYTPSETKQEGVVASKTGTKYHFPWCAGALAIREDNRLNFASPLAARAAGYTPAANCKGLE